MLIKLLDRELVLIVLFCLEVDIYDDGDLVNIQS
jgi:hypothetical protein